MSYIRIKFHGYLVSRNDEVMKRWTEFGTFSSIFRTHPGTLLSSV
jgi:alpha-glucosidase (family GH31 glycosyl hydrolase)